MCEICFPLAFHFYNSVPVFFDFLLDYLRCRFKVGNKGLCRINHIAGGLFQNFGVFIFKALFGFFKVSFRFFKRPFELFELFFGFAYALARIFDKGRFVSYAAEVFLNPVRHAEKLFKGGFKSLNMLLYPRYCFGFFLKLVLGKLLDIFH